MDVVNRKDVPSFITKDTCEIREIMSPANSTIERQSLAEATLAPGRSTVLHIHETVEEIYYIMSGEGVMFIEGEERDVFAGDAIANLPGKRHKITNTGDEPLVFLCICTPRYTHEDTVLIEE